MGYGRCMVEQKIEDLDGGGAVVGAEAQHRGFGLVMPDCIPKGYYQTMTTFRDP